MTDETYLPSRVSVGDRLRMVPFGLNEKARGVVVAVPAHRRFAVVEFDMDTMGLYHVHLRRRVRECIYINPAR